jgi:hypothetical protein
MIVKSIEIDNEICEQSVDIVFCIKRNGLKKYLYQIYMSYIFPTRKELSYQFDDVSNLDCKMDV